MQQYLEYLINFNERKTIKFNRRTGIINTIIYLYTILIFPFSSHFQDTQLLIGSFIAKLMRWREAEIPPLRVRKRTLSKIRLSIFS